MKARFEEVNGMKFVKHYNVETGKCCFNIRLTIKKMWWATKILIKGH